MGSKTLLITDLDGTLIKGDSFRMFLQYSSSGNLSFLLKSLVQLPTLIFWKIGFISAKKAKGIILKFFTRGIGKKGLMDLGKRFTNSVLERRFQKFIVDKIEWIKSGGGTVLVVSASPDIWVNPLAETLGAVAISSKLEFKGDRFLGKFQGENCQGKEKVIRIKQVVNLLEFEEILVFGNSQGDKPMLELGTKIWYKQKLTNSSSL
jgi:phosphatidylglycerophosphatase C